MSRLDDEIDRRQIGILLNPPFMQQTGTRPPHLTADPSRRRDAAERYEAPSLFIWLEQAEHDDQA